RTSAPITSTRKAASDQSRKRASGRTRPGPPTPAATAIRDLQTQPVHAISTSCIFRSLLTNLLYKHSRTIERKISVPEALWKVLALAVSPILLVIPHISVTNEKVLTHFARIPL